LNGWIEVAGGKAGLRWVVALTGTFTDGQQRCSAMAAVAGEGGLGQVEEWRAWGSDGIDMGLHQWPAALLSDGSGSW
jgi:hypothetical protein